MTSKFVYMPRFERAVKQLKKRYRNIIDDVEKVIESIESQPSTGTVIPNDYAVRKIRVASRDMQRGKSGCYRLLYLLSESTNQNMIVYLLFIYAKTDQENVSLTQLEELIEDIPPDA